jgi:4-diphosphocytidyl-2-C-methyl-D-erythritol kinase
VNTDEQQRFLKVRAYAKINLSLAVKGKRPDGYHLIRSHMQALSLHDDVTVEVFSGEGAAGFGVRVEMAPAPDVPDGATSPGGVVSSGTPANDILREFPQNADNLAYAAADLALRLWGRADGASAADARVVIAKRIPMAAGLAGGSADAAAVMLALARLLSPETRLQEIIAAGAQIGADTPCCISAVARGNPALGFAGDQAARAASLCEGVGDKLSPAAPESGWVVLVRPAVEASTPGVYAEWDALSAPATNGGGNDLTPAAIERYPLIGVVLHEVKEISRADRVFMTGSGPTIAALYADEGEAARGHAVLNNAYKNRADVGAVIISKLL